MRLFWGACVCFLTIQLVRCQVEKPGEKTTKFIQRKFATYEKTVRPYFGEKPLQVSVSGYVLDLHDINENNQEFTVSLYLRHEWKDPRLEFTESEAGTDTLLLTKEYTDKLWLVDTFIVNERDSKIHDLLSTNEFTRISTDGTVLISARYSVKASCKMELGWFPFDRHTCALIIESYGHTTADFIYNWKVDENGDSKKAIGVSQETSSIRFSVAGVNTRTEKLTFGNKSYSRLAVEFFLVRASTRFVHEVYLPAILLTLVSFITLFHGTGTSKTRLHLSIFIEGIIIILMALTSKTMPPVSYQTALDFYLVVCLLIVSGVVLVNVAICFMLSNATDTNGVVRLRSSTDQSVEDDGKEILFDIGAHLSSRTSRIFTLLIKLRLGIPLLFVIFNVLYWMIVLIGSSFFPDDFLILENWNV